MKVLVTGGAGDIGDGTNRILNGCDFAEWLIGCDSHGGHIGSYQLRFDQSHQHGNLTRKETFQCSARSCGRKKFDTGLEYLWKIMSKQQS